MTEEMQQLIRLFAENNITFKAQFFSDKSIYPKICAFLATACGTNMESEDLRISKALVENADDAMDQQAQEQFPLLCTQTSLGHDRDATMKNLIHAYRALREVCHPSPFLVLSASVLVDGCPQAEKYDEMAMRVKVLYEKMQEKHPFLTGYDDLAVCVLYVLCDKEDETALDEMEKCGEIVRNNRFYRNSTQALAQILAFFPNPEEASQKVPLLSVALSEQKIKLGTSWHCTVLGALACCYEEPDTVAQRVKEVSDLLKKKEGMGFLACPSKEREMIACLLVALHASRQHRIDPTFKYALHAAVLSVLSANTTDDLSGITNLPTN